MGNSISKYRFTNIIRRKISAEVHKLLCRIAEAGNIYIPGGSNDIMVILCRFFFKQLSGVCFKQSEILFVVNIILNYICNRLNDGKRKISKPLSNISNIRLFCIICKSSALVFLDNRPLRKLVFDINR